MNIYEHQTFKVGMIQMLKNCPILKFHDIIKNHFIENYNNMINIASNTINI